MHHLVNDIFRFGSAIFYETEKGEQFNNKFIRECLFRINRRCCCICKTYDGSPYGSWVVPGQSMPAKASNKVIECALLYDSTVRNFDDNNVDKMQINIGSTGVFKNRNNNLMIGEVGSIDVTHGTFTIIEYSVWHGSELITRFTPLYDCNSRGKIKLSSKYRLKLLVIVVFI